MGKRLLIVEDDAFLCDGLLELLGRENYEACCVSTASKAGEKIETNVFADPAPARGRHMDELERIDPDVLGSVLQIKPMRDWRRLSHVIDHVPDDDRNGTVGLKSTVAQRSALPGGSSNDRFGPVPGTVS